MEGFSVPKPILKSTKPSSTTTVPDSIDVSDSDQKNRIFFLQIFHFQLTHEPRKPESAVLNDLDYYRNLAPPPSPPGRPPVNLPQPTLKNPQPDMYLFFHQHPKTAQMAISPFRDEPHWSLIESKLKTDGTALVCTPDMILRDPRHSKIRNEQQQQYYSGQQFNTQQYGNRMSSSMNYYRPPHANNYNFGQMRQFRPQQLPPNDLRFYLNKK